MYYPHSKNIHNVKVRDVKLKILEFKVCFIILKFQKQIMACKWDVVYMT